MYSSNPMYQNMFGEYTIYFDKEIHFWFENMDKEKNYSAIEEKVEYYDFFKFWIKKTTPVFTWNILIDDNAKKLRKLLNL
jgi:hypothetical protein